MLDQLDENEEKVTVGSFGIKQGVYMGLFFILYSIPAFVFNLNTSILYSLLSYLIIIVVLAWSMNEFKNSNDGFMAYGQGVSLGALLSLVGSAISAGFSVLYMQLIDPAYIQRTLANSRIMLEERYPNFTDDQIEASLKFSEQVMQPYILFPASVIVLTIIGVILSLIVAAFVKKTNPSPF